MSEMISQTGSNPTTHILDNDKESKLPEMLNVLTILTLIGSGLGMLWAIIAYFRAQSSYDTMMEMQGKLDSMPDFLKSLYSPKMMEIARKSLENRLPILLLSLVALALCIYGALQMRQRKKAGFSIYLIGELLPVFTSVIFVGTGSFGVLTVVASLLIPVVFIILYGTQLKHLS